MHVLVAYASRHGATQGIAERIGETLRATGLEVEVRPAASVRSLAGYDAFVIGSAAYMFHWLKDAVDFTHRNKAALTGKPVWLFSSGPLGTEAVDAKGRDQKVAARPKEVDELIQIAGARDFRVFFGAYEKGRKPIGLAERLSDGLLAHMPAARDAMPVGDFRDWPEIEGWAAGIARDLQAVPVG